MSFTLVVQIAVALAAIAVLYGGYKIWWRRSIRKLVRDPFQRGHCVICDADLRFGKEKCPKCGHEISWVEAQIWEQALERRRSESKSP
jgi:predicted amidophosphoribosyltransferase